MSGVEGDPPGPGKRKRPIRDGGAPSQRTAEQPSHPPVAAAVLVLSVFVLLVILALVSTL